MSEKPKCPKCGRILKVSTAMWIRGTSSHPIGVGCHWPCKWSRAVSASEILSFATKAIR